MIPWTEIPLFSLIPVIRIHAKRSHNAWPTKIAKNAWSSCPTKPFFCEPTLLALWLCCHINKMFQIKWMYKKPAEKIIQSMVALDHHHQTEKKNKNTNSWKKKWKNDHYLCCNLSWVEWVFPRRLNSFVYKHTVIRNAWNLNIFLFRLYLNDNLQILFFSRRIYIYIYIYIYICTEKIIIFLRNLAIY